MSQVFNERLKRDYRLDYANFGVVYNPIQLEQISCCKRQPDGQIRLLFVGRISVRKGIELLLEAAPYILGRYSDVTITIVGGGSLWSNYEPLLKNLPKGMLWKGNRQHRQVVSEMENSDVLIVPSHYEPGGIVVGEALAAGMLVVASDIVGSAEVLSDEVCSRFRAGDIDGFLRAIDITISRVRSDPHFRATARNECEKHFAPSKIARRLLYELESSSSRPVTP
jgi:glycosyltransferase involved in cell wall biosynthesis